MGNKPTVFDCSIEEPHFTDIQEARKTVEGRVFKDKWTKIRVNDVLTISDGVGHKPQIVRKVKEVVRADNFGDLYDRFGESLVPRIKTRKRAEELYRQYFSDDLVKIHGVVGVVFYPPVGWDDPENPPNYGTLEKTEDIPII